MDKSEIQRRINDNKRSSIEGKSDLPINLFIHGEFTDKR
jgi:hypothetical protein